MTSPRQSLLAKLLLLAFCLLSIVSLPGADAISERKKLADEADKHITHLDIDAFDRAVQNETWLIMFGANWCSNTQNMTPKWLQVEKAYTERRYSDRGLHMAKVECSINGQHKSGHPFCDKHAPDGFPTINLYAHGKLIQEYPGDDDVDSILAYMERRLNAIAAAKLKADREAARKLEEERKKQSEAELRKSAEAKSKEIEGERIKASALAADAELAKAASDRKEGPSVAFLIVGLLALFTMLTLAYLWARKSRVSAKSSSYQSLDK
ncbi:Protein disulfide-isomerase A3 [Geranomyces variabilis]|uniref:Protein disulfide-isomerase A3 n=1 Tax=Geranomyces variabilis TaxID=109894 RepID=A0AAD5TQZ3_9FUNG|nr:Protein disulfide-isomerase A3 [Geranomyces variabilis]